MRSTIRMVVLAGSAVLAAAASLAVAVRADAEIINSPGYTHIQSFVPGTCVTQNGTDQLVMWRCLNTNNEEWRVDSVPVSPALYATCGCTAASMFVNHTTQECMAVENDTNITVDSGIAVLQRTCDTNDHKQWWLVEDSLYREDLGPIKVESFAVHGKTLDVDSARSDDGVPLRVWTYHGINHDNQRWRRFGPSFAVPEHLYVQNVQSDGCLTTNPGVIGVVQTACADRTNQRWVAIPVPSPISGSLVENLLVSEATSQCLAVLDYPVNGTPIVVAPCDVNNAREFWQKDLRYGTEPYAEYHLIVAQGGLCLDKPEGNSSQGLQIQAWTCAPFPPGDWNPFHDQHFEQWWRITAGPENESRAPSVYGANIPDAAMAIGAAGLTVGNVVQTVNPAAPGTVVGQNPSAGTAVATGTAMTITVSLGQATVPGVLGDDQWTAENAITAAGLTVGNESFNNDCISAGDVENQYPSPGVVAAPGAAVNLTISTCPGGGTDK
jgi:hypothetical protein